mmetsp:Transcript_6342/g.28655  ORF Transcript_6342/g.28655 Transcript_6342/m.28655 type:complete len:261 (+) Transcript_6342:420-1202(+)
MHRAPAESASCALACSTGSAASSISARSLAILPSMRPIASFARPASTCRPCDAARSASAAARAACASAASTFRFTELALHSRSSRSAATVSTARHAMSQASAVPHATPRDAPSSSVPAAVSSSMDFWTHVATSFGVTRPSSSSRETAVTAMWGCAPAQTPAAAATMTSAHPSSPASASDLVSSTSADSYRLRRTLWWVMHFWPCWSAATVSALAAPARPSASSLPLVLSHSMTSPAGFFSFMNACRSLSAPLLPLRVSRM